MCIYVAFVYTCVMYVYMHAEVEGLCPVTSSAALHIVCVFEAESLIESGAHWLAWLTRVLQGSTYLCSLGTRLKDGVLLSLVFLWVLGILTQVLTLTWQVLY